MLAWLVICRDILCCHRFRDCCSHRLSWSKMWIVSSWRNPPGWNAGICGGCEKNCRKFCEPLYQKIAFFSLARRPLLGNAIKEFSYFLNFSFLVKHGNRIKGTNHAECRIEFVSMLPADDWNTSARVRNSLHVVGKIYRASHPITILTNAMRTDQLGSGIRHLHTRLYRSLRRWGIQ